jgi:serine/threonine-protein kinase
MTVTLGFRLGETSSVTWPANWRGTSRRPVRVDEDSPLYVAGHWMAGADRWLRGGRLALPNQTRLSGRLYVKEGRVHGRFTEARTPLGVTYPVCLELLNTSDDVGLELEPGSAPGKMLVFPIAQVRVVDRFD